MARQRSLPEGMTERPGRSGYYSDFWAGGRRIVRKLATDFDAACAILIELRSRVQKAEHGLLDNQAPVAEIKKHYLATLRQTKKPRTVRCYEDWLDSILPALNVERVSQINDARIVDYREARQREGSRTNRRDAEFRPVSPRTINGEVQCLSTMLTWAVDRRLIASNPIRGLEPLPHDEPKDGRALEREEVQRLLEASAQPWRDIWYALLVTGMRKEELAELRFSAIHWRDREVIVRAAGAKNHLSRRIPIDDGLYTILERKFVECEQRQPGRGRNRRDTERCQARFTTDHVFVTTQNTPLDHKGNLWRTFVRCLEKAGVERQTYNGEGRVLLHVDLHSLRRTFATELIENGADPKTVQELLGHKTLTTTMKYYAKLRGGTKRQAMGKLSYGAGVQQAESVLEFAKKAE